MVAPPRASFREEVVFLLNQATELEHSLCCSYLFTSFSLKVRPEDGLSPELLEATRRWRNTFTAIAVEEMYHLCLVNDLLVGLGAAPNFDRPNFPHGCSYYMPEVHIELHPFSEETMRHFIAIEQPAGGALPFRKNALLATRVEGDADNEIGPDPHILASQGDVYDIVLEGIRSMAARLGEERVFIGPRPNAATERLLGGWRPMRDVASAEETLRRIVEEGEGGAADSPISHHFKFRTILDEYLTLKSQYPEFEPAHPVLDNPFTRTPVEASGPVQLLDDELAVRVSDLFNEVYSAMLHIFSRMFVLTEESDAEAQKLVAASMMLMSGAVASLGELLARLPAGPSHPGKTAGPSFVVGTMHALPYKEAAWFILRERFEELRDYTSQLGGSGGDASALVPVARALDRVARMFS